MLDQRLRRWSNIVQMLYKCFVFTGNSTPRQLAVPTGAGEEKHGVDFNMRTSKAG